MDHKEFIEDVDTFGDLKTQENFKVILKLKFIFIRKEHFYEKKS